MWQHILGNKNKQFNQDEDGTLFVKSNIEISNLIKNTKNPSSILKIEYINQKIRPMSAGVDDYLYGINQGNKRMVRSEDGFTTIEVGYDFLSTENGVPEFVTKTPTGFLVYLNHLDGLTASVWHSQSFSDGFEKVLDLTNGYVAGPFVPRPWHQLDGGIVMVAEYSVEKDIDRLPRCWISRRGGAVGSWVQINKLSVVDSVKNFHFHACCYDPWQSRIYTSKGDFENRKLEYSDDWGSTWKTIETTTQPTLLEPMSEFIVALPDYGDTVSVNQIVKSKNNSLAIEPYLEKKLEISSGQAYGNFGKGPVGGLTGSDEMYVTFSESGSGVRKCYIAGTGDGGKSWHLLLTLEPIEGNGLPFGIVTDPKTGIMYGAFTGKLYDDTNYQYLAKLTPPNWQ